MNEYKHNVSLAFIVVTAMGIYFLFIDLDYGEQATAFAPSKEPPIQNPPPSVQLPSANNTTIPSPTNEVSLYLNYENTTAGVKIDYPSDWTNYGSYGNEVIATFQAPFDLHGRPAVHVISKSMDDGENRKIKQYADTFFKSQEKNVEGYKIIEIETDGVSLSGKPAYRALHTYNICIGSCVGVEKRGKMLEIGTVDDSSKVIAIQYDAYESNYSKYLPIAQKMIDSFELK